MLFLLLVFLADPTVAVSSVSLESHEIFEPRGFDCSASGSVGLYDDSQAQFCLLNPSGSLVGKWGRRGKGPDEFQQVGGVYWSGYNNLFAVIDFGNARVHTLNEKGFQVSYRFPGLPQSARPIFQGHQLLGFVHLETDTLVFSDLKLNKRNLWQSDHVPEKGFAIKQGNQVMHASYKWHGRILLSSYQNRVVVTHTQFREVIIIEIGKTNSHQRFDHQLRPILVNEQDQKEALNSMPPFVRNQLKNELNPPEIWPFVSAISLDNQAIYLQSHQAADGFRVQVYNAEGRFLGQPQPLQSQANIKQDRALWIDEELTLNLEKLKAKP